MRITQLFLLLSIFTFILTSDNQMTKSLEGWEGWLWNLWLYSPLDSIFVWIGQMFNTGTTLGVPIVPWYLFSLLLLTILLQCASVPTGEQLPAFPDSPLCGGTWPTRACHILHWAQRRAQDGAVLQRQVAQVRMLIIYAKVFKLCWTVLRKRRVTEYKICLRTNRLVLGCQVYGIHC